MDGLHQDSGPMKPMATTAISITPVASAAESGGRARQNRNRAAAARAQVSAGEATTLIATTTVAPRAIPAQGNRRASSAAASPRASNAMVTTLASGRPVDA